MVSNVPQEPETTFLITRNGISGNGKQKFKKRQMCMKCQEIGHRDEELAKRGLHVIRTKLKSKQWPDTMCRLHARQAGLCKDKLFDNAGKMQNQHQQKKLPFMVLNKSQFQMAEVSQGSEDNPLRNPMEEC
jgi:hypothetical protein